MMQGSVENEGAEKVGRRVVADFGEEWAAFDQTELDEAEHRRIFNAYFSLFPFDELREAEGFDLGCGSGRWAELVAPLVGKLHCIEPAEKALDVARKRMAGATNVQFHRAQADQIPLPNSSQDFGFSLGVLHHIPDAERAMRDCVGKLKPGAPFLVYLYYRFDDRPRWFRALWRASDIARMGISRLPFRIKKMVTNTIAFTVYHPLARCARWLERRGKDVSFFPLSAYRHHSFYTMRTDALDRFGTKLEQRFTRPEIQTMMERCGLTDIRFRDDEPFWVACGRKARGGQGA